jgi:hypothetical protein
MDQRYLELPIVVPSVPPGLGLVTGDWVYVRTPKFPVTGVINSVIEALPGWYLLFLVSDSGYVSDGKWVKL